MRSTTEPTAARVLPPGITLESVKALPPSTDRVLTTEALVFVAGLERAFGARRRELLSLREGLQLRLDSGVRPDFLAQTADVRAGDWRVAPIPAPLLRREVEITGPVDRKMVINALNSDADLFMADFEDSNSPTFENCVEGQANLADAVRRTIELNDEARGKHYQLNDDPAVLLVRPRGWHLEEAHLLIDGQPCSAALFDFGLYLFHNAKELLARGAGPYFYLPKLESHLEARLWNDVFVAASKTLGLELGTIKATVLIETITAAFEMDEILFELKDHMAGLNCGRWDYIFSFIKRFSNDPAFVMPDRGSVGMDRRFLKSYSELLIRTCHRRGAFAMGGMAAQIPIKNDANANEAAMAKVHADKRREAASGHDGTWVAHPGLVAIARAEFGKVMQGDNQLHVAREDVAVTAADLLAVPAGEITEAGLRQNLEVGVRYLAAWLCGSGCVPIHNLMEDAATAEISRVQVWQWIRHGAEMSDGRNVDVDLALAVLDEELAKLRTELGDTAFTENRFELAADLFRDMLRASVCPEFLTLAAYEHLDG